MRGSVLFVVLRSSQILAPEPHRIYCQHEEDYNNNPPTKGEPAMDSQQICRYIIVDAQNHWPERA
jgi:hypothetical protein